MAEHGNVTEHGVVVDLLEAVTADLGERHLPCDRQDGRVALRCVVEAVEEVERSGSDGPRTHPERSGQLRLGAGRERTDLFVPDPDPINPVGSSDGIGEGVQRVPDHSEHLMHTVIDERVHYDVCDSATHGVDVVCWRRWRYAIDVAVT